MKIEKNQPHQLIFYKGDSWVSIHLNRGSTKIGVTQSDMAGTPMLGLKNIATLTAWLAEADRQIRATKKLRKQADSDRLAGSE